MGQKLLTICQEQIKMISYKITAAVCLLVLALHEVTSEETCTYICRNDGSCQIKYYYSDNGYGRQGTGNCISYNNCALDTVPRCKGYQECCSRGVGTHTESLREGHTTRTNQRQPAVSQRSQSNECYTKYETVCDAVGCPVVYEEKCETVYDTVYESICKQAGPQGRVHPCPQGGLQWEQTEVQTGRAADLLDPLHQAGPTSQQGAKGTAPAF